MNFCSGFICLQYVILNTYRIVSGSEFTVIYSYSYSCIGAMLCDGSILQQSGALSVEQGF